ncbi:hypothetical protein BN2476_340106 [Paraburkholderia piptadeniae]|uniref:Uncharacterized protein n=1 Tax=Paraburkholderia piptadeniae TaxID=1701573 RepID=A0A1N7S743_9BURK|nr:hypothetical protein BN2476_340106 [Paraburkholderia piptadeniae]
MVAFIRFGGIHFSAAGAFEADTVSAGTGRKQDRTTNRAPIVRLPNTSANAIDRRLFRCA